MCVVLFNSCVGPPEDYKLITKDNIPYLSDPWNDFLGVKNGEVIGIVLPINKKTVPLGYRDVFFKHYDSDSFKTHYGTDVDIPFKYVAKNCDIGRNREGQLSFFLINKKVPDELLGKEYLIIGTVVNEIAITPKHACDDTHATIYLEDVYIELYDSKKLDDHQNEISNNFIIGPEYNTPEDIYGVFCDPDEDIYPDCSHLIVLGNIKDFEKDLKGMSKKNIKISKTGKWDGYSVRQSSKFAGIGFWKVIKYSPIVQSNNYPSTTAGELFNGAEILIEWMPDGSGLSYGVDGKYIIRNSPQNVDWSDPDSQEKYRVILRHQRVGPIKFQKTKGTLTK